MSSRDEGEDAGAATVWAAGAIAALLLIAGVVWTLGAAVVARQRASGAADLAALAAAGQADAGVAIACEHAGDLARRMAAQVAECRLDGWDALVVVQAEVSGFAGLESTVTAKARAGPIAGTAPSLG